MTAEPFEGVDEIADLAEYSHESRMKNVRKWVRNTHRLREPPECILDMTVIVVPVYKRSDNHGHALHRLVPALRVKHEIISQSANTLLIYALDVQDETEDEMRAYQYLHELANTSWASVFMQRPSHPFLKSLKWNGVPPQVSLCFSQVIIPSQCRQLPGTDERLACVNMDAIASSRFAFRLFGQRLQTELQATQLVRNLVSNCISKPLRRAPNASAPRVGYVFRSRSRVDEAASHLMLTYAEIAERVGAHSFQVVEYALLDPRFVFELFMDFDVLVGVFGTGMLWLLLMPPGATLGHLRGDISIGSGESHWNIPRYRWLDFEAYAQMAHINSLMVPVLLLQHSKPYGSWILSRKMWESIFVALICGVDRNASDVERLCRLKSN